MKNTNMNRRTFLKVTTVAGSGALLVGCTFQSNPNLSASNSKIRGFGTVYPYRKGQ